MLAQRYEAAIKASYEDLANGFFNRPLEELISKSRKDGRIQIQGSKWFILHTDEIVAEYDYEVELVARIRRDGAKALTDSYSNF